MSSRDYIFNKAQNEGLTWTFDYQEDTEQVSDYLS